jgi:hypothetical protein
MLISNIYNFLLTLKPKADETAQKTIVVFYQMCLVITFLHPFPAWEDPFCQTKSNRCTLTDRLVFLRNENWWGGGGGGPRRQQ